MLHPANLPSNPPFRSVPYQHHRHSHASPFVVIQIRRPFIPAIHNFHQSKSFSFFCHLPRINYESKLKFHSRNSFSQRAFAYDSISFICWWMKYLLDLKPSQTHLRSASYNLVFGHPRPIQPGHLTLLAWHDSDTIRRLGLRDEIPIRWADVKRGKVTN